MTIDLSRKTALVTGATGELGRVIARTLAQCGADIIVHYHANGGKAQEIATEIEQMGRRAQTVQCDVTSREAVAAMRAVIQHGLGSPHIVVLNAVSQYTWTSVMEQPLEDYEDQFRACVAQTVLLTQAFAPAMIARESGRIIGINTECAMQCQPSQSAYVAGKRGMDGVLRVLAREIGPHNITVNQVAPGWTISEKDRRDGTQSQPGYESGVPLRRRGEDLDIAHAVAFLASEQARFITGTVLPVCGGNVMPTI
jgi:3-oxoacyl-[acyl-carrier protein] reductase